MTLLLLIFSILAVFMLVVYVLSLFRRKPRPKKSPKPQQQPQEYPTLQVANEILSIQLPEEKEEEIAVRRLTQLDILNQEVETLENTYFDAPGERWDILIAMGDMYSRGSFPVAKPDTSTAERLYRSAAMSPDSLIAGIAQMKMVEIKMSPVVIDDIDSDGGMIDPMPGWRTSERAVEQIKMTPWRHFARPRYAGRKEEEEVPTQTRNTPTTTITPAPAPAAPPAAFMHDAQNVHDHAVAQTLARTLENIRTRESSDVDRQAADALELMNETLSIEMDPKERGNAIQVISNLSNLTHSKFDQTEREVLSNVMQKIREQKDEKLRKNLTETLVKQLATGVENGFVVCSSGKIARITGALDGSGIQEVEQTRPLWAVREELGSLASKMNEAGRTGEDFRKEAHNVYIDELGLNSSIVEPIIREFAEHLLG